MSTSENTSASGSSGRGTTGSDMEDDLLDFETGVGSKRMQKEIAMANAQAKMEMSKNN